MARNAQTDQQITGTWTFPKGATKMSCSWWAHRPASGTKQIVGALATAAECVCAYHWTDDNMYIDLRRSVGGTGGFAYALENITGWNHWCWTYDGSQSTNDGRLKLYKNGVNIALTFSGTIPASISSQTAVEDFRINGGIGTGFGTGYYAEIGAWLETLNASEVTALYKGASPSRIRTSSLEMYIPLVRDLVDVVGGMTLTNTNTTVIEHVRVYA